MRVRRAALGSSLGVAFVAVAALCGCAIQADTAPRDVPADHPARGNLDSGGEGAEATGEGRIYLLAPGELDQPLRTVLRDTEGSPQQLIETLVDGPNEAEVGAGLRSELPQSLEVLSVRVGDGVVQVDLSDDILELQGRQLTLAVAQIVFTASEIAGAESVVIRVDGETRAWPNGSNEQQTSPLTVYDFVNFAESAQPPYPVIPAPQLTSSSTPPAVTAPPATTSPAPNTTA